MTKRIALSIMGVLNNKKTQYLSFFLFTFTIVFLIGLRDVLNININKFVFIAPIVFLLPLNKTKLFYSFIFTFFLKSGIPYNYFLISFFALFLIRSRFRFSILHIFFVIVFSAYELFISLINSKIASFNILDFLSFVFTSFLAIYIIFTNEIQINKKKMVLFALLCIFLENTIIMGNTFRILIYADHHRYSYWPTIGFTYWFSHIRFGDPTYLVNSLTTSFRITGLSVQEMCLKLNANEVGLHALLAHGFIAILFLYFKRKSKKSSILIVVGLLSLLVYFSFIGVISQSRTFLIVFPILYLSILVYLLIKKIIDIRVFTIVICSIVSLSCVFYLLFPSIIESFLQRIFSTEIGNNSRTIVFMEYNNFLFNNPFFLIFGTGINSSVAISGASDAVHNNIQQIIVCHGIIGFLFIYMPFYFCAAVSNLRIYFKKKLLYMLPLFVFVAWTFLNQLIAPVGLTLLLSFLLFLAKDYSPSKKTRFDFFYSKIASEHSFKEYLRLTKSKLKRYLINCSLPKLNKKLVIFDSDDWGSLRSNINAKKALLDVGINMDKNIFTSTDCLEDFNDLEDLRNSLKQHLDSKGNHPIFTLNYMIANPDFDKMKKNGYSKFEDVSFLEEYEKRSINISYLNELINDKVVLPQLHGCSHINSMRWLKDIKNDKNLNIASNNCVWSISSCFSKNNKMSYMDEFNIYDNKDFEQHLEELKSANEFFKSIFGFYSVSFVPACNVFKGSYFTKLSDCNIKYLKIAADYYEPKKQWQLKKKPAFIRALFNKNIIIRNCTFEPSMIGVNSISSCLESIDYAFKHKRPAIICTHRVNYVGGIDPKQKERDLILLNDLITRILNDYPDVVFGSVKDLEN